MAVLPDEMSVEAVLDQVVESIKTVSQLSTTKKLIHHLGAKSTIDQVADPFHIACKIIQIVDSHSQVIQLEWLYPLLQFARENVIFSSHDDIMHQQHQQNGQNLIGCVENLKEKMLGLIEEWDQKEFYKITDDLPPYLIYAELDLLGQLLKAKFNHDSSLQSIYNLYNKCFDIIESVLVYDYQRLIALANELTTCMDSDQSYRSRYIYLDIMTKIICCSYCSFNQREFAYCGGQIFYLDGSIFTMQSYYSIWKTIQSNLDCKLSKLHANIIYHKGFTDSLKMIQSIKLPTNIRYQIKSDFANMMSLYGDSYLDYLIWYHRQSLSDLVHDDLLAKLTMLELSPKYSGIAVRLSDIDFIPILTQLPPTMIDLPSSKEALIPRLDYFNQIYHDMDVQGHHNVVLTGSAGVGKSSLALHYARSHTIHYNCIHWFHAETEISLQNGFIKLANVILENENNFTSKQSQQLLSIRHCFDQFTETSELLQSGDSHIIIATPLHTSDQQRIDVINKLVEATLAFVTTHYSFLLIYDNADQEEMVRRYMPEKEGNGLVLITSRYRNWLDMDHIPVQLFQRQQSVDYLLQRTNSRDDESANLIANQICDLPLALSQAVAYIQRTGISLDAYHNRLITEERDIAKDSYAPAHYKKYQQVNCDQIKMSQQLTPTTTWSSTFSQLIAKYPSIQSIFMLISYIQVDQLTDDLLYEFCQQQDPNINEEDYQNGLSGLIHYHALQQCCDENINSYKTNKLIQLAMRNCILEIVSIQLGHSLGDWIYVQDIILCRILVYLVDKLSDDHPIVSDDMMVSRTLNLIYQADQLRQHLVNSELFSDQRIMLEEKMTKLYTTVTTPLTQLETDIMAKIKNFQLVGTYQ